MRRACRSTAALAAALALGACDNSPAAPGLFTTETFAGTVARQGSSAHTFITAQTSPTVLRVGTLSPTIAMGLALGTPTPSATGDVCSVTIGQAAVQQGDTFQVELDPGTYCVMVFDLGNVVEGATVAYSVTVQHR